MIPGESGTYDVEFFAANGEGELEYELSIYLDAELGPGNEPGTASITRQISLVATFNP